MKYLIIILLLASCTQKQQRSLKSLKSNFTGGLERECTVYSNTGKPIRQYKGKFDIEGVDRIVMDLNGKRNIVYRGIVICEEL